MTYKPIAHEGERGNWIYGNDKQQGDLHGYDISPSNNLNNVVYSTKRSKSTPKVTLFLSELPIKAIKGMLEIPLITIDGPMLNHRSAMSRYEQFGSTNKNNHSEEVFWAARTRKLKKRCPQERIT